jgi:hypothetical protein
VFLSVELAASILMGVLDIVLTALAIYAYARCRQSLFLVLAAGTLAFVFTNFYAAMLTYSALTRTTIFSPAVAHFFATCYVIVSPIAGIVLFAGTVLLIRFTLGLHDRTRA